MNVSQVKDVVRDIDSRSIDDLILAKATLQLIDDGYQDYGFDADEWVIDGISSLSREITNRHRAQLEKRLKVAKVRRQDLATVSEKRKSLDSEITNLEKALNG